MTPCANLGPFCDGELSPATAAAFRAHLPNCGSCQRGLHEWMQLSAQLDALSKFADTAVQPQWGGTSTPPVVTRGPWWRRLVRLLSW